MSPILLLSWLLTGLTLLPSVVLPLLYTSVDKVQIKPSKEPDIFTCCFSTIIKTAV